VVEMLVRAQGGYVRAENLPGGGAAFHITIPRA
jgi:signal transduction histidine kinase